MTSALHFRALDALPAPLAALISAHAFADELQELVQEAALALLAAPGDSEQQIYKRARSRVRRFTQNVAHYARALDVADDIDITGDEPSGGGRKRRELTRDIAQQHGVKKRRARQIVAAQVERARQGDLFIGYESGVAA